MTPGPNTLAICKTAERGPMGCRSQQGSWPPLPPLRGTAFMPGSSLCLSAKASSGLFLLAILFSSAMHGRSFAAARLMRCVAAGAMIAIGLTAPHSS
ncbi:hypothetical protein [uncultured Paracoccus sp.]|uniref:hypothetical protein n=1 Tax=uncultured Paracoccus sp. TaxID=189685 RepID=UPI0025D63306|nr:hypothetical protein [uncultured Paracoccus sp.]